MSFKPLYAFKIVEGTKDCEVRTYFSYIPKDSKVLIYASSPTRAIIGEFVVDEVFIGSYVEVAKYLRNYCYQFDEDNWGFFNKHYLGSKRRLIVLRIKDPTRYSRPLRLNELRRIIPNFRPPISYVKINKELYFLLKELAI